MLLLLIIELNVPLRVCCLSNIKMRIILLSLLWKEVNYCSSLRVNFMALESHWGSTA